MSGSRSREVSMKHWLVAMFMALSAMPFAQAQNYMEAFPPAEAGVVRHVLEVPKQDDESAFKVELAVGKTVHTDPHNRYFFGGGIL